MREIKFRAWDDRHYEMRYSDKHDGEFYINLKGAVYIYAIPKSEGYIGDTQYYKTYDLMQYTGLKDKNGVEIYKSDLLDIEEYGKAKVIFLDGAFMAEWLHEDCYSMELSQITWKNRNKKDLFKVIGNIYENPEKLKKD